MGSEVSVQLWGEVEQRKNIPVGMTIKPAQSAKQCNELIYSWESFRLNTMTSLLPK